ncbi:MAG: 30S ribosomal protein S15 [Candidatus Methanospirareceae archaeon]
MARLYTSKRGRSGSKKPVRKEPPEWVELSPEEVEEKVVELYRKGLSTSEIGMVLRDSYGVPSVALVTGKKITKILKEHNLAPAIPEDLRNLIRRALRIRKHLDIHKKDFHNKRALQLTEAKIGRLVRYYKKEKVLPEDWEYKPEIAEFIITRR